MDDRERQGWIIVGAIFVTMFFVWGAINSGAVFFVPVLKHFGWTRARLSVALSIGWITGGAAGPLIGLLADRVSPKRLMMTGATITGLAWLALSRTNSFAEFATINGLFGISVGLATGIPSTLLIASWFQQRRGLAIGIAFSGSTLGGAAMAIVANYAIAAGGWRFGYVTLATPILLVVAPLIILLIRANPEVASAAERIDAPPAARVSAVPIELPGLEIAQAFKTRSFWLISAAQLLGGLTLGMGPHYVAYLTGIGYSATFAATAISLYLVVTTGGTLLGGPVADKFGARTAMIATYVVGALGMIGMLGASVPAALVLNVLAGGFAGGALAVQMPLVMIESLGIKRFGSVMGITGIFFTFGAAVSPIITGRIFDVTGSYRIAISSFIAMLILGSIAMLGCRPLYREEEQFAPPAPSIAS
jgi:MFS family permease